MCRYHIPWIPSELVTHINIFSLHNTKCQTPPATPQQYFMKWKTLIQFQSHNLDKHLRCTGCLLSFIVMKFPVCKFHYYPPLCPGLLSPLVYTLLSVTGEMLNDYIESETGISKDL